MSKYREPINDLDLRLAYEADKVELMLRVHCTWIPVYSLTSSFEGLVRLRSSGYKLRIVLD